MGLPKCEHGVSAADGRFVGEWNAPFSTCECCGVRFPYCDTGSISARGFESRTWQPRNKCGQCGGGYVEESYLTPTPEAAQK